MTTKLVTILGYCEFKGSGMRARVWQFIGIIGFVLSGAASAADLEIPFEETVLDNGLRVIVHQDTKAPIVAVNVWYHVGSKNERPGKTGFAHLFEHLMFNGSENYDGEFFEPFDQVGATGQNGTTNFDRTNYFQNVPKTALDMALWMESDRMGHLLGAITQEKLDVQRGVVQNEKRQGENQPYGTVYSHVFKAVFPEGHPYSWMPIGSMEDLDAASLDDVKHWFKTYYGPNNATVVIAGDVEPEHAFERVAHFFGDIPAGPPIARHKVRVPKLSGHARELIEDRVPQARIYKVWAAPNWAAKDADALGLVGDILASGKTSRLYERLVYRDQIATSVSASPFFGEIAGLMIVSASVKPGGDIATVERAIDEELQRFLDKGPTKDELKRVRTQYRAGFIRGVERIGGFGGKSDILAQNAVYAGRADFYQESLDRVSAATTKSLQAVAERWLGAGQGTYTLEVVPFVERTNAEAGADRSQLPMPDEFPSVGFDAFERGSLSNGLDVIVATRDAVPVINMRLLIDAGFAADQGNLAGTANLAMSMLDEGTDKRDALAISEALGQIGAFVGAGANLDMSFVTLNTLVSELDEALGLYADIILNPAFPEAEIERLRGLQKAAIQREQATPRQMALRVFPKLLYGEDHAYSLPFTGSGTLDSLAEISRADLARYHDTWFRPNNATLVIVGDTTLAEIKPKLERVFASWEPAEVPAKKLANVAHRDKETIYLIDRPGSQQSIIFAGHILPPKANEAEVAIQAMNDVLGGEFTARVNMNLREDKHWAYGAYTYVVDAKGQRPFIGIAPVQTDKTAESMAELRREMVEIIGDRPPEAAELDRVRNSSTLSLPGRWETAGSVAGSLAAIVRYGFEDDYWQRYPESIRALTLDEVSQAAQDVLRPDSLIWVVVGDRSVIEPAIEALGLGSVQLIDTEGNRVAQ